MSVHVLKTWPDSFGDVLAGTKTYELRKDDREFRVGDVLWLQEYEPVPDRLTGREVSAEIVHILRDCPYFGLLPGYVVLGIAR